MLVELGQVWLQVLVELGQLRGQLRHGGQFRQSHAAILQAMAAVVEAVRHAGDLH